MTDHAAPSTAPDGAARPAPEGAAPPAADGAAPPAADGASRSAPPAPDDAAPLDPGPGAVTADRLLAAPAEHVWDVVTDVRRHEAWIPMTRIDAADTLGLGATFAGISGPTATRGGPGLVDRMVVEVLDPPAPAGRGHGARTGVARYRKTGPVLLGVAEVRVRPLGPGHTVLTWVEDVYLRLPGRPADRPVPAWWRAATGAVVRVPLALMLRLALRRIADDVLR